MEQVEQAFVMERGANHIFPKSKKPKKSHEEKQNPKLPPTNFGRTMTRSPQIKGNDESACTSIGAVGGSESANLSQMSPSQKASASAKDLQYRGTPPLSSAALSCTVCGKRAQRRGCLSMSCLGCCKDPNCEVHSERRANEEKRRLLLEGEDEVTLLAAEYRNYKLERGVFKEDAFLYNGETVTVWSKGDFFQNSKFREHIYRKFKGVRGKTRKKLSHEKARSLRKAKLEAVIEGFLRKAKSASG